MKKIVKYIDITEKLVNDYASLTGDKNPIHVNADYAKSSIFKNKIAHGMLVSSFISSIIANDFPGKGSIYLSQNLKFIKPCYLNTTLKYVIEQYDKVKDKYFLHTKVYNELNEIILDGSAVVLFKN